MEFCGPHYFCKQKEKINQKLVLCGKEFNGRSCNVKMKVKKKSDYDVEKNTISSMLASHMSVKGIKRLRRSIARNKWYRENQELKYKTGM